MPLFEYVCKTCGKQTEFLVRSSGEKPVCVCGSDTLDRVFSPFAVSGFHGDAGGCADGSCGIPASPCASGMCGL